MSSAACSHEVAFNVGWHEGSPLYECASCHAALVYPLVGDPEDRPVARAKEKPVVAHKTFPWLQKFGLFGRIA